MKCCPWSFRQSVDIATMQREIHELENELYVSRGTAVRSDVWNIVTKANSFVVQWYECKICMDAPIETVFLPCGHAMSCVTCSANTHVCPACRLPVSSLTRLHML